MKKLLGSLLLMLVSACASDPSPTSVVQGAVGDPVFPIKLSTDGRGLVDQNNIPFLVHGDTAWDLMLDLSPTDVDQYLDDRKAKGFTSVLCSMIVHMQNDMSLHPSNYAGQQPFTVHGDFTTPNETYFANVDSVMQKAAARGMLLYVTYSYLGFQGDSSGFFSEMKAAGHTAMHAWGNWIGARYANQPNIVWVSGGDFTPSDPDKWVVDDVVAGIKEMDANHLHTVHGTSNQPSLDAWPAAAHPWLDVGTTYSWDDPLYVRLLLDYHHAGFKPFVMIESRYENEMAGPPEVRREAYWSLLSGAAGHFFGSKPVWGSEAGWQAGLASAGSQQMAYVKDAFHTRAWSRLVPDDAHAVLTSGWGNYGTTDYVTAARVSDGSLVMAYAPNTGTGARALTVDMANLATTAKAAWMNPTTGVYSTVTGSPFANSGMRTFVTPGNNGTDTNDWLLVIETNLSAGCGGSGGAGGAGGSVGAGGTTGSAGTGGSVGAAGSGGAAGTGGGSAGAGGTGGAPVVVYRINSGGPAYTDPSGGVWQADTLFNTGIIDVTTATVTGTTMSPLYQSLRWDASGGPELRYALPIANGTYTVRLHFAETYSGAATAGKRVFKVLIEGATVLASYDVAASVGFLHADIKTFVATVTDGSLTIDFQHVIENPIISAIEVLQ